MRFCTSRILAVGLATVLSLGPVALAGVTPVGILSGSDKVKLNGNPLTSSQPALPGDTVEAPGAAVASLQLAPNGVARLTAAARATVERSGQEVWLNLQNGYVTVKEGDQPMSVRAHGGKISGAPGTVFDVAQDKAKTTVTVVKGSVVLSEGGLLAPRTVSAGQNVLVAFVAPGPGVPMGFDPQAKPAAATCNDPCKGSDTKACTDFKNLKTTCTPLRKACAKDATKCAEYQKTCAALTGCRGYGGLGAAGSAAGAAGAGAAGAASAGAAASGAAVSATAITAAAAAAAAAGVAGVATAAAGSDNATTRVSP